LLLPVIFGLLDPAAAQIPAGHTVEIGVSLPLTGDGSTTFGRGTLEGIQFAIEEANAHAGSGPVIKLDIHDDQASDKAVTEVAEKIIASRAMLVIGPSYSTASLTQGPLYAKAGIASLCPTATSDAITDAATTFRMLFKNSQQGEALAVYLARVLIGRRADVIVVNNKYGQTLRSGFEQAAKQLGIDAQWSTYKTMDEADAIARRLGADHTDRAIVFLTLDDDAARMLTTLRRLGARGPFLGADALGDEGFSALFAKEAEEQRQPGFFTDSVFGVAPMILDSANAETLAFAERFRARFGHDPIWMAVAGYDAGRMAAAAIRAVMSGNGARGDLRTQRAAAVAWLAAQNSLDKALPGLLGPLSFDKQRGGHKAVRIGRFYQGHFESAPLQIVTVDRPNRADIDRGTVFRTADGWARMQRVVYSGMFLNEVPRIDIAQSTFTADLYLWMRYARVTAADADPGDIQFPTLLRGNFDPSKPAAQGELDDGTVYRLWKVHGDFKNDFDLHHYPADRQNLNVQFFNARAPSDRIVYVRDRRSQGNPEAPLVTGALASASDAAATGNAAPAEAIGDSASPDAFRNLTQWTLLRAAQGRDNQVTTSALGDPRLVGVERVRELSGYGVSIEMRRKIVATMAKTLLPLGLMALIMFASLYFPTALVKEKVTVAITAALSGAVLLTSINSQLGNVGYVMAVEYVFYIFFALCLVCIVAVLGEERLRAARRPALAIAVDQAGRALFLLGLLGTIAAGFWAVAQW
jgi:ABC-type branched-subunit amino acid transport system substrate-binding protein